MKYRYITPESETLEMQFAHCILDDSPADLVDYYGGDDVIPIDGEW